MATSGEFLLATDGDFLMAMDTPHCRLAAEVRSCRARQVITNAGQTPPSHSHVDNSN
jgi:hypothetical protein